MGLKQPIYRLDDLKLENNELLLNETIFHNANGYIGIRANFEEGYPKDYDTIRGTYINGFYDIARMPQAEKLYGLIEEKQTILNVADTQTIQLSVDGEVFNMFEGIVLKSERWLDMEQGITGRKVHWQSVSGKEIELTIKRMAAFHQPSLFTIEYSVKALNFTGTIKITSHHLGDVRNYSNDKDPRVAAESPRYLHPVKAFQESGITYLQSQTSSSGLFVCSAVSHVLSKDISCSTICSESDHKAITTMEFKISADETVTLKKYSVFSDSIRYTDCVSDAREKMVEALSSPLEYHYEKQRKYLKKFWEGCLLEIEGDDNLTAALNYNMYQLIQSVGKDEYCNIAAKGLSGEGYEGHYFWDTEMYMEPFFNLTAPEITKNLISFRYNTLSSARENAKLMGHEKGALYPWRTIAGRECSGYFPSGSAAYHINGDIAYSIISYYLTTKDLDFIAEKGGEILFETARLWLEVGNYSQDTFRINEVTGPDEYTCMVNNNYYTNVLAKYNLNWAVKFYHLLKAAEKSGVIEKISLTQEEIDSFKKAADRMYLPYDEELKINPQDDSFLHKKTWDLEATPKDKFPLLLHYHPLHLYRYQVCKQADTVLAHFILEDEQDLDTIKNSYDYYEKFTTHDSSLSTCVFSIMAAKLGRMDKAYDYFGDSALLDLFNTHKNTKDGIHTANMGGAYMAIIYGFAGLRIKESGISFAPRIPGKWDSYKFILQYEDSRILVEISKDNNTFTLLDGSSKVIKVYGTDYELKDVLMVPTFIKD